MILSRLKVGPIQTNCYVVKSDTSDVGFVVDPGASADKILEEVDKPVSYTHLKTGRQRYI